MRCRDWGDIKPDPGITEMGVHRDKYKPSGQALKYPIQNSLITGATQRTRIRARNQVRKKI